MKTLYTEIKAAGIPHDNHYSDLYIQDTPRSREILARYPLEKSNSKSFRNQAPPNVGQLWIDVPFAFDPYWEKKQQREHNADAMDANHPTQTPK